jgi:hypothetical protein
MEYRGWRIYEVLRNPVTGRWVGTQNGVEICGNTEDMIKRMVDHKVVEEMERTFDEPLHKGGK